MALRVLIGFAILVLVLFAVITVNTVRVGPTPLTGIPPADTISVDSYAAARRLAGAIGYETISHGRGKPEASEALNGLRAFLSESFPTVHKVLKREIIGDYSLLYTWEGANTNLNPLLFSAHMDVVPVEPGTEKDWTYPPFSGAVEGDFIWGRGAMDMKAALTGILEAVEYLLTKDFQPQRTILLAFGHDEEVGGMKGAARITELLRERSVRLELSLDEGMPIADGILPEVEKSVALIGVAEKGYLTLELTATGPGGHSSMPPPAGTAVGRLGRAIGRIETNRMPAAMKSPAVDMLEYLAPDMPVHLRAIIANRWLFETLLLDRLGRQPATNATIRTTAAPTIIAGGVKPNVLPTEAKATVNFRILPGDSVEKVIKRVRTAIADPNIDVKVSGIDAWEPSPVSSTSSAGFTTLRRTVQQIFPDTAVAPGLVIGATDSRHYAKIADNSYRFLPIRLTGNDLKRIHGTNEHITVENYAEIIRFYAQFMLNAAG